MYVCMYAFHYHPHFRKDSRADRTFMLHPSGRKDSRALMVNRVVIILHFNELSVHMVGPSMTPKERLMNPLEVKAHSLGTTALGSL